VYTATIIYRSSADTEPLTSTITNATPTIDSVYSSITSDTDTSPTTDDAIMTLIDANVLNIYAHGQATDLNGCSELDTSLAIFYWKAYMTSDPNGHAGSSNTTCSTNTSTDCTYGSSSGGYGAVFQCGSETDTVSTYEIPISLDYFSNPTDASSVNSSTNWTVKISANDYPVVGSPKRSAVATDTFEVASLIGLSLGNGFVSFGELFPGETSDWVGDSIINRGNTDIDLDLYGSNWSCSSGSMNASQTHYSLSSTNTYASMTALLNTSSSLDITVPTQTRTDINSDKNIYFRLLIPKSGVAGTCNSTATLFAKQNS